MIHTHFCYNHQGNYYCNEEYQKNWENENEKVFCATIEEMLCLDCLILETEVSNSTM